MLNDRRAPTTGRAKRVATVAAPARSGGAGEGREEMELVDNPVGLRAIHPGVRQSGRAPPYFGA